MDKKSDLKDLRCLCGSLMARLLEGSVELKCKRCKRIHLIPLSTGDRDRLPLGRRKPER